MFNFYTFRLLLLLPADDVNNTCTGTGNRDHTASNLPHHSNHHSQISSALSPNCSGVNQIVQRCYQKRRRNRGTKNKDSRKKTKPPGLSLLEILCADFENGALLAKGTESIDQSVSGLKNYLSNLDRESSNKAHRTGVDKEALHIDSDKSLKLTKLKDTNGQSCTCKSSSEVIQSGHGETLGNSNSDLSKSKSVKIEGINCNSPNESSISKLCMSSQETVALRDKSTRNLSNWTSQVFNNNCELRKNGAKPIDSQSHEGNCSKQFQRKIIEKLAGRSASLDIADRKNEKAILSHHSSWAESVGAQTSEKSRFVHFKEKRKQSKRKGKKGNCVDKSKCKEKLNRTRSSGVKLFQVDGLQSSQQRKSQVRHAKPMKKTMQSEHATEHATSSKRGKIGAHARAFIQSQLTRLSPATWIILFHVLIHPGLLNFLRLM